MDQMAKEKKSSRPQTTQLMTEETQKVTFGQNNLQVKSAVSLTEQQREQSISSPEFGNVKSKKTKNVKDANSSKPKIDLTKAKQGRLSTSPIKPTSLSHRKVDNKTIAGNKMQAPITVIKGDLVCFGE